MVYDRDLKWSVRASWGLLALNGGGALHSLWRRDWFTTAAYVIWICNIFMWRGMLKNSQRTRDMGRLTDAAILKVLELPRVE
jgi:hypothetical protein